MPWALGSFGIKLAWLRASSDYWRATTGLLIAPPQPSHTCEIDLYRRRCAEADALPPCVGSSSMGWSPRWSSA